MALCPRLIGKSAVGSKMPPRSSMKDESWRKYNPQAAILRGSSASPTSRKNSYRGYKGNQAGDLLAHAPGRLASDHPVIALTNA
jgi:hypothetical protein